MSGITLRGTYENFRGVNQELQERLSVAGVEVTKTRLNSLAIMQLKLASSMLQRQKQRQYYSELRQTHC